MEIDEAIKSIITRHDPGYDHNNPASVTSVQVVLVGYSKGTLSSRLYLKSLQVQQPDFPPLKPGFMLSLPSREIVRKRGDSGRLQLPRPRGEYQG